MSFHPAVASSRHALRLSRTHFRLRLSTSPRFSISQIMAIKTLTEAIKHDHQEMYEYHDEYKRAEGNVDAQERWANQLMWEIARHAVSEEIIVYPLMEKHLGAEGLRLADEDRADHQIVKELLEKLERLKAGTPAYTTTIDDIMKHLHEHNDSEEINDLPKLELVLGTENSQAAAASFKRTKTFVPTRAHPWAPNKPPYETLAGFLVTPVDLLKDFFSKFPTDEMKEDAKENK